LQIVRLDCLAEADVALGDQHINRLQLCDRGGSGLFVRPARKICGYAAGDDGNGKDCNACGIHTLHFPHYSATLGAAVTGVDQLFVKAWLMERE
jgi:hypothetical protein